MNHLIMEIIRQMVKNMAWLDLQLKLFDFIYNDGKLEDLDKLK